MSTQAMTQLIADNFNFGEVVEEDSIDGSQLVLRTNSGWYLRLSCQIGTSSLG